MDPIPNAVTRFLNANIDSVDQLELLRLIAANPQQEHSSLALAKELQLPLEVTESNLKALQSRGLLAVTSEQPFVCRYGPPSAEIDSQLRMLVETYQQRPVTLIKMVYDNQKQLRLFSEAFRLKGKE